MTNLREQLRRSLEMEPPRQHFTGFILAQIYRAMDGGEITIDNAQQNGAHGVHQRRVRLKGDDTVYRLILAPANAPIELYGRPIGDAFAEPLGDS